MKYYHIHPEVAGYFGEHAVIDRSSGRMVVQRLHYEFETWPRDGLLTSCPSFIASERLAHEIERARLTGVTFDEVEITVSDIFRELHPEPRPPLPRFVWLRVHGKAGVDDFGIFSFAYLIVSERALELLRKVGFSNGGPTTPFATPGKSS